MNKVIVTGIIFLSILTNLINASITWSALGSGANGTVRAIAVSGSDVYVGGDFTTVGGISANHVAKWNSASGWSALGDGVNNNIWALAISGSDIYVGGQFTQAGGSSANYIAKWNGSTWSALGSGLNGAVRAIAISGSDIYAGGEFTSPAFAIAMWNGSSWSALGTSVNGSVYCIAVSDPNVYVGGAFTIAGGSSANKIAKWNGSNWYALGDGLDEYVNTIATSGSNIYAGGQFTHSGVTTTNYIAQWDGSSWSAIGGGIGDMVRSIAISGTDVYVGGYFITAGGNSANRIAKWDGSNWSDLGSGVNAAVWALAVNTSEGKMYVGGEFTDAGGNSNGDHIASFIDSDNSLPVELTDFTAENQFGSVLLKWSTESETENIGFILERKISVGANHDLPSSWLQIASYTTDKMLEGHGSTSEKHEYQFTDKTVQPGVTYRYRLADVDYSGKVTWHKEVEVKVEIGEVQFPVVFGLQSVYPNPFNPRTTITYQIPEPEFVKITIYDLTGRPVAVLINDHKPAGIYQIDWKPQTLSSGIYLIHVQAGSYTSVQKCLMVK